MLGACDLSVVARVWPRPARLLRSCRAQAHSGGTGPGAPAHGQVDVDGHVQQRQTVAAGAASERPGESGRRQGAHSVGARLGSSRVGSWGWRWGGAEGQRASASPDRVMIRSYRLRAVLGLGGGGKARGVSGLNGESSTLWGLLGTHVQGPGHSARGVTIRQLRSLGRSLPVLLVGRGLPAGGRGRS